MYNNNNNNNSDNPVLRMFNAIDTNNCLQLWHILENELSGVTYITYNGETPQTYAKRLNRQQIISTLDTHQKLSYIRAKFDL
ncbi:unnamed protein product [Didymodactylos carnosus]|uniref:Uncharacterized protein n=1 Tax=Didymodactylos carnosus TaxID=1234261 RepID=A0A814HT76_9BILA|nr:unnamed protein product [Didymodactylos carnosus]CAF1013837.1 unnamed protein product [Didymodactylos carnosus]CAF3748807.1 unnamed protein product [Didymodactylos carnosus]CAF3785382.1 unnamed protein product [Didymodactylos carnosus]